MKQKVAQGRFYGPDATPHDLGDNPIRSEFNTTLENGQRTKLEETFTFDHDGDGGQTTPDLAKTTTYDWVYDANDRLLSETIDHHDDALDRTESFVMDLFGNRTNRAIDYADPTAVDQAFAYSYDDNDRLTTETLDESANGSIDQTTRYSWDSTQQTAKEVFTGSSTNPADIISSQSFSYDLQGRLAEVITTPETGPATKVTYSYDSFGIRVSSSQFTDANSNGIFETSELDHTVNYLVDHRNHTGYAQTITETATDANGDNVSRTTYTFGTDELSQTTYTPDPATADAWLADAMHFFGHDAHGSVRVLLDALGEIAQTFTYAAYGELLAIYDTTGALADTSAALTSLLYSGESFDSRIGQQYLRARWYDAAAGRFSRLDPYFGTLRGPLSFNKYNYVHSNPIQGIDPTGRFFSTGGFLGASGIGTTLNGLTLEAGNSVAQAFGADGVAIDPLSIALGWAWEQLPQALQTRIKSVVSELYKRFPQLAVAAGVVGVVYGSPSVRQKITRHFGNIAGAIGSVGTRLTRQLDLQKRLARVGRFIDPDRNGKFIQWREALGIARWEQFTGLAAKEADSVTHAGADFVSGARRVSLKGPMGLSNSGKKRLVTQSNLDHQIQVIVKDANGRHNTGSTEVAVDMLGLSAEQKKYVVAQLELQSNTFVKPVIILD